tara:strand:+ start:2761 stop:3633 length:873 start_codon:yes stop_codon:yes gene_type:complete
MAKKVNDDYPGNAPAMSDKQLKDIATAKYNSKAAESEETQVFDFPTEIVELPSKGKLYPEGHPLRKGTIEMKYMTAKEEDILTNQSFIKQGVVLDKLFRSLIVTPCEYNDLIICDKNAVMIAARVLGYGKEYPVKVKNPTTNEEVEHTVDLTQLEEREIDWSMITDGVNEFPFELPASKRNVKVKILTQRDQTKIDKETKGLAKLKKTATATVTMKNVIVELDGERDNMKIRQFVDKELLALDSRAIRQFLKKITPDIEMRIEVPDGESGDTFRVPLSIGLDFFWPDVEI